MHVCHGVIEEKGVNHIVFSSFEWAIIQEVHQIVWDVLLGYERREWQTKKDGTHQAPSIVQSSILGPLHTRD